MSDDLSGKLFQQKIKVTHPTTSIFMLITAHSFFEYNLEKHSPCGSSTHCNTLLTLAPPLMARNIWRTGDMEQKLLYFSLWSLYVHC